MKGMRILKKNSRAHEKLDDMKGILGQWDVAVSIYPTDSTSYKSTGTADISYMNRGYAYMSRLHFPAFDESGNEANMMQFLTYAPFTNNWVMGEANSHSESISMYNGDLADGKLLLSTAVRRNGGTLVVYSQIAYELHTPKKFSMSLQTATSPKGPWRTVMEQVYTRRQKSAAFMATQAGIGEPAPTRPAETAEFDFLLGEWNAAHQINLNGQWIQYATNATAVHVLNGNAILEHSWFNTDPNLPEAATSIVRLYNRSMRRWESLYLANRGNSPLFFGGQKEGDDIVLHNFESTTSSGPIPKYVFHDITADTYAWYAESSTDRGHTFEKRWIINFDRKEE